MTFQRYSRNFVSSTIATYRARTNGRLVTRASPQKKKKEIGVVEGRCTVNSARMIEWKKKGNKERGRKRGRSLARSMSGHGNRPGGRLPAGDERRIRRGTATKKKKNTENKIREQQIRSMTIEIYPGNEKMVPVLLEVVLPLEGLSADLAGEGHVVLMAALVDHEVVGLREAPLAVLADELYRALGAHLLPAAELPAVPLCLHRHYREHPYKFPPLLLLGRLSVSFPSTSSLAVLLTPQSHSLHLVAAYGRLCRASWTAGRFSRSREHTVPVPLFCRPCRFFFVFSRLLFASSRANLVPG